MTRAELNKFLDGDYLVKYDGELYYFDNIAGDGMVTMRDINNDYAHGVRLVDMLHNRRYSARKF